MRINKWKKKRKFRKNSILISSSFTNFFIKGISLKIFKKFYKFFSKINFFILQILGITEPIAYTIILIFFF